MKKIISVFAILIICFLITPKVFAAEGSLFLEPITGSYPTKGNFSVKIKVDSAGTTINAGKAKISFPIDLLEVQSVSKSGSIFQLWPEEPTFSNSQGEITFGGGVPSPGFTGIGTILTINFKIKKVGEANVTISDGQVLAADGRGTNILSFAKGGTYLFYSISEVIPEENKPPSAEIQPPLEEVVLIPAPEILVYPKTYTPGEELFYVEGKALASSTVIIFLEHNEKIIRTWETSSDKNGNWTFSTDELFKSGEYLLSARNKDSKGNISISSTEYKVKIILVGFSIGSWIILYSYLSIFLIILIILIAIVLIYIVFSKDRKDKERLKKETKEAKESLENTFIELGKELVRKIEYFDSKPGLSPQERKLRDEIFYLLKNSEKSVSKEIKDIEKELE